MPQPADLTSDHSGFIWSTVILNEDQNVENLKRVLDDAQRAVNQALTALRRASDQLGAELREDRKQAATKPPSPLGPFRPAQPKPAKRAPEDLIEEIGARVSAVASLARVIESSSKVDSTAWLYGRHFDIDAFARGVVSGVQYQVDKLPNAARHARPWYREDWRKKRDSPTATLRADAAAQKSASSVMQSQAQASSQRAAALRPARSGISPFRG